MVININLADCDQQSSKGKRVCLQCGQCQQTFKGAWDLMFHVQSAHGINIYKLSENNEVIFIYDIST